MAQTRAIPRAQPRARFRLGAKRQDWPWALLFLAPNLRPLSRLLGLPDRLRCSTSASSDWKIVGPQEVGRPPELRQFFQDDMTLKLLWKLDLLRPRLDHPADRHLALARHPAQRGRLRPERLARHLLPAAGVLAGGGGCGLEVALRQGPGADQLLPRPARRHRIDWLYSTVWAMPALIVMTIWQLLPFNTIVYLAGLQEIPRTSLRRGGGRRRLRLAPVP